MKICYINRKTKTREEEHVYGGRAIQILYGDSLFSRIVFYALLPFLVQIPWVSKFYGWIQTTKWSQRKIEPFIQKYHVDRSEFLIQKFDSFNDFFMRKLKPGVRPFPVDSHILALPADGRYLMFQNISQADHFYIKGHKFQLASFLQDERLAKRFEGGCLIIARLCPADYHRFHFPCDGLIQEIKKISGPLYSVNPLALRKKPSILIENKREMTLLQTTHFGLIAYVEIGATFVGAIHQTCKVGDQVKKGEEKGYFSFGGSCLVLLFEQGRVSLDLDFLDNSSRGLETKALFGERFGALVD